MKKMYQKPVLIKEAFAVEEWLTACTVVNPNPAMYTCTYTPKNLGWGPIFNSDFLVHCSMSEEEWEGMIGMDMLCLMSGVNNVFGS